MSFLVRYALIGAGVFALQWLVLGRLTLWGSYPDAVLLFVAWIGLREGRRVGSLAGFGLGALMSAGGLVAEVLVEPPALAARERLGGVVGWRALVVRVQVRRTHD